MKKPILISRLFIIGRIITLDTYVLIVYYTSMEINNIQEYLAVISNLRTKHPDYHYHGVEDFISQHGQTYDVRKKPKHIPYDTKQECYRNALRFVWNNPSYTYVEGFATTGILPVQHAWVVNENNEIIDTTWRWQPDALQTWRYFGVPFSIDVINAAVLISKNIRSI